MTQEIYSLSNLNSLLSKDDITEDDLLHLPELLLEESKNSPNETPLIHESENLSINPTDKPRVTLKDRAKKRTPTVPSRQFFRRQKNRRNYT